MTRPNCRLYGLFVDRITVRVLNPGVIADSSQVLDKIQCLVRVVRVYFCAAARTFRLNNHAHSSSYPFAIVGP